MDYKTNIFRAMKSFARFRRNAIIFLDPCDLVHMMSETNYIMMNLESMKLFNECTPEEFDHILNLIDKMNEQSLETATTIRSSIWGLLNEIHDYDERRYYEAIQ